MCKSRAGAASADTVTAANAAAAAVTALAEDPNSVEAMLQRALAMSTETPEENLPDFAYMIE